MDRFKFHRVIKLFRELESQAKVRQAANETEVEEVRPLVENMPLSILIAVLLGVIAYLLDKFLTRKENQEL